MAAVEFPPMRKGESFNLDAVKAKIAAAQAAIAKQAVPDTGRLYDAPTPYVDMPMAEIQLSVAQSLYPKIGGPSGPIWNPIDG